MGLPVHYLTVHPGASVRLVVACPVSSFSSRAPHTSQCHAGTRIPVLGSFSGLYCSHAGSSPRGRPSAGNRSMSALTKGTHGPPPGGGGRKPHPPPAGKG